MDRLAVFFARRICVCVYESARVSSQAEWVKEMPGSGSLSVSVCVCIGRRRRRSFAYFVSRGKYRGMFHAHVCSECVFVCVRAL